MAHETKDTTAAASAATVKDAKARAAADPLATKNLVRLLNILALLLAITAFLLQFFAVISHHWKYQATNLSGISANNYRAQGNIPADSQVVQSYGLFSRNVKLYANHDQHLDAWTSTRFARLNSDDENLYQCYSPKTSLRAAALTCANGLFPNSQCNCRRYPHWNAVIFFEIAALVLLGLVVVIAALLATHYHGLLKPIGVALSFLAFLFLLIGLILILSYLKRETRSIADTYPHVHGKYNNAFDQRYQTVLHRAVRRQAQQTFQAYNLAEGQYYYNETHFQQYSPEQGAYVYIPYTSLNPNAGVPRSRTNDDQPTTTTTAEAPTYNKYGPLLGYKQVYEHTRARIGWSTILSILAMLLALLLPLLLAYSWLTGKKLGPEVKTVTTTTVRTEYVPVPQDVTVETVPLTRPVPQGPYDNYAGRAEAVVVRDDHPTTQTYRA